MRALALVVAAVLLAGCSGSPSADPTDPAAPSAPSDPTGTASTTPGTAVTTPESSDPLTFTSRGRGCMELRAGSEYVFWEDVEAAEDVTVTAISMVSPRGVDELGMTWALKPKGEISHTGGRLSPMPRRYWDRLNYADRAPLGSGAELGAGETFYWFQELRVDGPGGYDGVDFSWTTPDGRSGVSRWETALRIRKKC